MPPPPPLSLPKSAPAPVHDLGPERTCAVDQFDSWNLHKCNVLHLYFAGLFFPFVPLKALFCRSAVFGIFECVAATLKLPCAFWFIRSVEKRDFHTQPVTYAASQLAIASATFHFFVSDCISNLHLQRDICWKMRFVPPTTADQTS